MDAVTQSQQAQRQDQREALQDKRRLTRANRDRTLLRRQRNLAQSLAVRLTAVTLLTGAFAAYVQQEQWQVAADAQITQAAVSVATYWDNNLSEETRMLTGRIVDALHKWKRRGVPQTEQDKALLFVVDRQLVNNPAALRANGYAMEMLHQDKNARDEDLTRAASQSRTALVKTLNTFETVCILRLHLKSDAAKRIIDESDKASIVASVRADYGPIMRLYRDGCQDKEPDAWKSIDTLINGQWANP